MEPQQASSRPAHVSDAVPQPAICPQLSICIVNWNCCQYLRKLLASIEAARDDLVLETIVVDNASTDDSAEMVQAEFPEVQLIRNRVHQGVARANNRAAARARGSLLLFLNNDTVVAPGALTALVQFVDLHPEVALISPRIVLPDGKIQGGVRARLSYRALLHRIWFLRGTRLFRAADRAYHQVDFDLHRSSYVQQIVGAALLMRRRQFLSVGGWDEAFEFRMDDIDLSDRLGQLGKIYYLAEAQVMHWGGVATELDRTYAYLHGEYSTIYYIEKNFGAAAARTYKMLVLADMPVRLFVLGLCWLVKRLFGSRERAARGYRKLTAAWHFVAHELPFFAGLLRKEPEAQSAGASFPSPGDSFRYGAGAEKQYLSKTPPAS